MTEQLDLLNWTPKVKPPAEVRGMARNPDHETSVAAAQAIKDGLSDLQQEVIGYLTEKPMTDEELAARRPDLAWSTLSKRRTELFQKGIVVEAGTTINSRGRKVKVWRLA